MAINSGGQTLADAIAALPKARQRAIERRAAQLIAEEMSLRELRKSLSLTQAHVAQRLGKAQHEISRIEQRGDMLLSTLQRLVQALGGELELVCRFGARPPVRIIPQAGNAKLRGDSRPRVRPKGRTPA